MSHDLVIAGPERFLPVLSVADAVQRRCAIIEFVQRVMKPGVDFGTIPGTPKPTLLKPGAEKLCTLFGLTSRFQNSSVYRGLERRAARGRAVLLLSLPLSALARRSADCRGRRLLQQLRAEVPVSRGAARLPAVRQTGHRQGPPGVRRRVALLRQEGRLRREISRRRRVHRRPAGRARPQSRHRGRGQHDPEDGAETGTGRCDAARRQRLRVFHAGRRRSPDRGPAGSCRSCFRCAGTGSAPAERCRSARRLSCTRIEIGGA